MDNLAPVRSLNRRSRQLLQIAFIIAAVGIFLFVVGRAVVTISLLPPSHQLFQLYIGVGNGLSVLGGLLVIVAVAIMLRAVTRRRENDLALLTGDVLSQTGYFDQRFIFIRNINRSGLGYIDAVMLGPPGALVFRILSEKGIYANEASSWLKQNTRGEWFPSPINPTKQIIEDIQRLRQYLAKHTLGDAPVFGVIVFTTGEPAIQFVGKEPTVPVTHLNTLMENLGRNYLVKMDRIPQQTASAVRRLLMDEG